MIERYLEIDDDQEAERVLDIQSYRQMLEICKQFKLLFKQRAATTRPNTVETSMSASGLTGSARLMANSHPTDNDSSVRNGQFVGELDPRQNGFSLGFDHDAASPAFIYRTSAVSGKRVSVCVDSVGSLNLK